MKCSEIMEALRRLSPEQYACDWDNVGLLVGRKDKEVRKIMVALDASKEVVSLAADRKVDMLITHHPMIFSSLKKINEDDFVAEKALVLAEHGISYYAMHTNFDAVGGMAELAAGKQYLDLRDTSPIVLSGETGEGMGRYGKLPRPMTAKEAAEYVKDKFGLSFVLLYQGQDTKNQVFEKIAVLPGSGKSEMMQVKEQGYTLYVTGDYGHHGGLDAIDMGMTVIDATHYGLEHIFIAYISGYLRDTFGDAVEIIETDSGCPVKVI